MKQRVEVEALTCTVIRRQVRSHSGTRRFYQATISVILSVRILVTVLSLYVRNCTGTVLGYSRCRNDRFDGITPDPETQNHRDAILPRNRASSWSRQRVRVRRCVCHMDARVRALVKQIAEVQSSACSKRAASDAIDTQRALAFPRVAWPSLRRSQCQRCRV